MTRSSSRSVRRRSVVCRRRRSINRLPIVGECTRRRIGRDRRPQWARGRRVGHHGRLPRCPRHLARDPGCTTRAQLRAAMGSPTGRPADVVRARGRARPPVEPVRDRPRGRHRRWVSVDHLPADLPIGYHDLVPTDGGVATRLVVHPRRCPAVPRTWGVAAQVYALWSAASLGHRRPVRCSPAGRIDRRCRRRQRCCSARCTSPLRHCRRNRAPTTPALDARGTRC